jgi:hypothetical protein
MDKMATDMDMVMAKTATDMGMDTTAITVMGITAKATKAKAIITITTLRRLRQLQKAYRHRPQAPKATHARIGSITTLPTTVGCRDSKVDLPHRFSLNGIKFPFDTKL